MPVSRLLACFAHPDDEAFPVGGALAAHASRGVEIRLVTATSGEEGEIRQEGAATRETLGSIRRVELSCAIQGLEKLGHRVARRGPGIHDGKVQLILLDRERGVLKGASDPRGDGHAAAW